MNGFIIEAGWLSFSRYSGSRDVAIVQGVVYMRIQIETTNFSSLVFFFLQRNLKEPILFIAEKGTEALFACL